MAASGLCWLLALGSRIWFLSNLCLSFFICVVGMATVPKLIRLLVAFHDMMNAK